MKLSEVVPWGRTFAEYQLMFSLSQADLETQILGCGDGPASFNLEMTALGHSVISVDPIYQFSAEEIRQRVQKAYEPVISQVRQNAHSYIWNNFQDADELGQVRLATMERFLLDYEAGKIEKRYQYQSLPHLELADNQFGLCLCSHLLFLYSEQLSLDFHLASIAELLRVGQEVRIFPLLKLNGEPSPFKEIVMEALTNKGFDVRVQSVAYELQKGGNQMMKINRKS
ncbi:MAG: SAM-dependent methyltransferase [Symploca sp. SIO2E6]|nr:SAM-dependent methyltransferase [Symploca sp. SIO2E6]